MELAKSQFGYPIYYIMSDQPDCCRRCGSRLELREIKNVNGERVFVSECLGCHCEVLLVEDYAVGYAASGQPTLRI